MAETPNPKSQEQLIGEMLADYISETGVNDVNVGSLVTQLFETVALTVGRASGDGFQILRDRSVDRAVGEALRRIARDEGLRELPARVSSGAVTTTDTSFVKISTKVYAGSRAPNIGSTVIDLSDASAFPATGFVYLGRNTPNIEGPIPYSNPTPVGGYWQITLGAPTTKFHNINESVVVAQGGNRTIAQNTVVRAPATGASEDISFTVTQPAVILDGEVSASDIQVSAQIPGSSGNVPIGSVREFSSLPFVGATVTNPLPFKTGRDVETDDQLKIRIKRARLSRGLGTPLAVKSSVIGATPSDENAVVVSSEIQTSAGETTLYVDDGTGYEQKTRGVGVEVLVDSALGGETNFQLQTGGRQTSVAKAFIVSNLKSPFDLREGDRLALSVGGVTTEHTFSNSDFISPGGATAFEVVSSINSNSTLRFESATAEGGTKVVLQAKANDNEDLQAVDVTLGRNAATIMGMPSNKIETIKLFKNKSPLSKDGSSAVVMSERQAEWSNTIANGDTLIVSVDGTSFVTYTFLNADFVAEGSHNTVSASNSLESWINVINSKVTGLTATIVGEQIYITSNLGTSNRAKLEVSGLSTLVSKNMFSTANGLVSVGKSADFEFSRNTAQIRLNQPLAAQDELTVGSRDTEARVDSARILGGTVTLPTDANIWILVDDKDSEIVNTGVTAQTLLTVSTPSPDVVRYQSSVPTAFASLQVGDYVIIWSEELSAPNRLEGRVNAFTSDSMDIKITSSEAALVVPEAGVVYQEGLVVLRTSKVPQKLQAVSGVRFIGDIADELNGQLKSGEFFTVDDEIIAVKTNTKTEEGAVLVVTFDESGKLLSFVAGSSDQSKDSLLAFYESGYREGSFPSFIHSDFSSESSAVPPSTFISSIFSTFDPSLESLDPTGNIGYLNPYGTILDALSTSEFTELDDYAATELFLDQDPLVKRLRILDRYYFARPLDLGHEDELVVVLDGDAPNKTFSIPFFRRSETNTSLAVNPNTFNAYDSDGGPTTPFTQFFGANFDFKNFKVLMQAKRVLDPSIASEDAILYRSVRWGRSGERINVAYTYPTVPNSGILHTISVGENVDVRISLKSGAPVPNNIDGTTEWDVTITPNTPVAGVDQVTYTWTGTGSAPGLGGLAGGEYVNISKGSELDVKNTGLFRVSTEVGFAPTANSFTVVRKNGEAVAELNRATLVAGIFSFYQADPTTAQEVVDYAASSALANILSATIVDDGGTSGAGVISKSTLEQSDFLVESLFLLDGINWIASSDISNSPNFTLKRPLAYPSDTGYAFNEAEPLRIVPTSVEQAVRFTNILAVTGYTTLGNISLVSREGKLELATRLLGGEGSIEIVGGNANSSSAPVIGNSTSSMNRYAITSVSRSAISSLHSDQYVKLSADFKQEKNTSFRTTANISIDGDAETIGKSVVSFTGRTLTDRHFGRPRNHIRSRDRVFKVEKQGDFTCISWDKNGPAPQFSISVDLDLTSTGTLNIEKIQNSSEANIFVLDGPLNFYALNLGELITVSGMDSPENNGEFLITGISNDGKTLRIVNPSAVSEFSIGTASILDNANISGDEFVIGGNSLVAGIDFVVGATADDTAINLAAAIGSIPGFSANAVLNVVNIEATGSNSMATLVYNDLGGGGGGAVSGPNLVGRGYAPGNFTSLTSVSEGDTVILSSPFAALNQGKFRVIRRMEDSFYIDNQNSVEETVTLPANLIDLDVDGTTEITILDINGRGLVRWSGVGTEPFFAGARPGDELVLGSDFNINNQGTWTVLDSGKKLQQITLATIPSGAQLTTGQYWFVNGAEDLNQYYVWYNVDGGGGDPLIGGRIGIEVAVSSVDTSIQTANATAAAIDAVVDLEADSNLNQVTVTTTEFAESSEATAETMTAPFTVQTTQLGRRTFMEILLLSPFSEANILITDVFELHRPQMKFWEYEASVQGDAFMITSDFLGDDNQGTWIIDEVLNQDTVSVIGTMLDTPSTSISNNQEALLVEEEFPYVGYKQVRTVLADPASNTRGLIVFSTKEQFNKINDSGSVQVSSVSRLAFDTTIKKGLDSYRYHTGIIGEANRIVYGDPRDNVTYPGVAAAGAEIFIREPLFRRIRLSIDVRIETGVPFAQIVEQVRTNVSSLIEANDIGQSIAISDIVEIVNIIPGVRAVAISSPLYNASNDTIRITPAEKARIIDPTTDVQVRQINT